MAAFERKEKERQRHEEKRKWGERWERKMGRNAPTPGTSTVKSRKKSTIASEEPESEKIKTAGEKITPKSS
jgi:hypothetical protein